MKLLFGHYYSILVSGMKNLLPKKGDEAVKNKPLLW